MLKQFMQPKREEPVNVCCIECDFWGWVGIYNKAREGYICEECLDG